MSSGTGLFAAGHGRLVGAKPCVHLGGRIRPQESTVRNGNKLTLWCYADKAGYVFLDDSGIGSCQSLVTISRNVVDDRRFVDMHERKSSAHQSSKEATPTSERYRENLVSFNLYSSLRNASRMALQLLLEEEACDKQCE
jgi:hypothetical protein